MEHALDLGVTQHWSGAEGERALRLGAERSSAPFERVAHTAISPSEAYARVRRELAAIPANERLQVNLDVHSTLRVVGCALPNLSALREQIKTALPVFDLVTFDKLEDYALALSYAHTRYLLAGRRPPELRPVAAEAARVRDTLLEEAVALANHGLVPEAVFDRLSRRTGYKNLAHDLHVLSGVLREHWPQIRRKCATTSADLNRANQLATRLLRAGERRHGPSEATLAWDSCRRAFTLFVRAYAQARYAVRCLRQRHGDAISSVPSLYPARPNHQRSPKPRIEETKSDNGSHPS
jgi:hypothetical protein